MSTLFDIRIALALSLALLIMAAFMIVFLLIATGGGGQPKLKVNHLQGFKGETLTTTTELRRRRIGWVSVHADSAVTGAGETSATIRDGKVTMTFEAKYAGRFKGMRLRLEFMDPLHLFSKVHDVYYEDFTLDGLPLSLLGPPSAGRPLMLSQGEEPAGAPGTGQELFSIDKYEAFNETKNIIWKRVARSSDESLFVRIRESNVPSVVRIGMIDAVPRDERLEWVDLLCEGVGLLGLYLLDRGSRLQVTHESDDRLVVSQVSDLQGLAEALLSFTASVSGNQFIGQLVERSDVLVTGLKEAEQPEIALAISRKPAMLVYEKAAPAHVGERSIVFSGRESLFPLIARVMER